jgi:hypothetical protein
MPNRYGLNRTFGVAIGAIAIVVLISGTTVFLAQRKRVAQTLRVIVRETFWPNSTPFSMAC